MSARLLAGAKEHFQETEQYHADDGRCQINLYTGNLFHHITKVLLARAREKGSRLVGATIPIAMGKVSPAKPGAKGTDKKYGQLDDDECQGGKNTENRMPTRAMLGSWARFR